MANTTLIAQPVVHVGAALTDLLDSSAERLRLGSPWAAAAAVTGLCETWSQARSWPKLRKEALVGMEGGVTPPRAFEALRGFGFDIRVPGAPEVLECPGLRLRPLNHAKVICADGGRGAPFVIMVGSANLTEAGLGTIRAANSELVTVTRGEGDADERAILEPFAYWWESRWAESAPLSSQLLQSYAKKRKPLLDSRAEEIGEIHSSSSDEAWSLLWIEVPASAVSGGSRSQIDIPNDAGRRFFGLTPGKRFREKIEIRHASNSMRKVMDWRGAAGLNQQFRLNLLTSRQGGPSSYDGTILVIRLRSSSPLAVEIRVLRPGSTEARVLRSASEARGALFETLPGRSNSREWGLL